MRMHNNHQLCAAPGGTQRCRREPSLAAVASGENELSPAHGHTVQLWRFVEAQETAFHSAPFGKLGEHGSDVAPRALDSAG
jgi:hypothetical protein